MTRETTFKTISLNSTNFQQDSCVELHRHTPVRCATCGEEEVVAMCHHCGRFLCQKHVARPRFYQEASREFHSMVGGKLSSRAAHCKEDSHFVFSARKVIILPGVVLTVLTFPFTTFRLMSFLSMVSTAIRANHSLKVLLPALGTLLSSGSLTLIGLALIGIGTYLYFNRLRPLAEDVPLQTIPVVPDQYDLRIKEHIQVNLRISERDDVPHLQLVTHWGKLTVNATVDRNAAKSYRAYQKRSQKYGWNVQSNPFDFGFIVLDTPQDVSVVKGPTPIGIAHNVYHLLMQGFPIEEVEQEDWRWERLIECDTTISPRALRFGEKKGFRGRGVLWLTPVIEPLSAGHTVHFLFNLPDEVEAEWRLKRMVMQVPRGAFGAGRAEFPILETNGQAYPERFEVCWTEWPVGRIKHWPQVTFVEDVTHLCQPLKMNFEIEIEELLSGTRLQPKHLWLPTGSPATKGPSGIAVHHLTSLIGKAQIDPEVFSYRREHTCTSCLEQRVQARPELVRNLIQTLTREGVAVKNVTQGEPVVETREEAIRKVTWDILGRYYARIYPVDLHIVLSERSPLDAKTNQESSVTAQLTTRVLLSTKAAGMEKAVERLHEKFTRILEQTIR